MFCTNCGKEIPAKNRFCVSCGKELVISKKPTKIGRKKLVLISIAVFLIVGAGVLSWFLLHKSVKTPEQVSQQPTQRKEILDYTKEMGVKNLTAAFESGVFINSFKKYILFIDKIDGSRLFNVRIYEPQEGKPLRTIVAERGEFIVQAQTKTIKLKLIDGTSDEPSTEDPTKFYKLNFKTYFMELELAEAQNGENQQKLKDMVIQKLKTEANENESTAQAKLKLNIAQNESEAESEAQKTLKLISAALENYAVVHSGAFPSSLSDLVQASPPYLVKDYIAQSPLEGYIYSCSRLESSGYSCSAVPVKVGSTGIRGKRSFRITTGGIMESEE